MMVIGLFYGMYICEHLEVENITFLTFVLWNLFNFNLFNNLIHYFLP